MVYYYFLIICMNYYIDCDKYLLKIYYEYFKIYNYCLILSMLLLYGNNCNLNLHIMVLYCNKWFIIFQSNYSWIKKIYYNSAWWCFMLLEQQSRLNNKLCLIPCVTCYIGITNSQRQPTSGFCRFQD